MSDCEPYEFDEGLLELNNWQIEQHSKLKLFQEAQRKLLDSEHEKILNSLKTQDYEQRHLIHDADALPYSSMPAVENWPELNSKTSNYIVNIKSDAIKLKDPKINLCSIPQFCQSEKSDELSNVNHEEHENTEPVRPRGFLKRGEGLARFRMTIDDFKTPPDIYKDKRIRTYLNQKPENNRRKKQFKAVKQSNETKKKPGSCFNKPVSMPVNIYVTENKKQKSTIKSACDSKVNRVPPCSKKRELPIVKTPMRTLTLKPVMYVNNSRNTSEGDSNCNISKKSEEILIASPKSPDRSTIDKQIKKDERELRMFEMLEGRIDDGSLSPNSSLVAKFMEESLCSTPSKPLSGDCEKGIAYSYMKNIRALQRQYLTPEQIERIKECDADNFSRDACTEDNVEDMKSSSSFRNFGDSIYNEEEKINDDCDFYEQQKTPQTEDEKKDSYKEAAVNLQREVTPLLPESVKSNKILQDYVENFKQLKNDMQECCNQSDSEESIAEKNSPDAVNDQVLCQREIAIKLQRKALQDNVKNLLNWEGLTRKKPPKKVIKRIKGKCPAKTEKTKKTEKAEDDKSLSNNGLLKERLEELEKEIEIFKRENKNLTQLQRECDAEKSKLLRERKEFEKYIQEEKEKFETRMNEEQRKLQRDKNVFDKYCKQMKNQPNKKEREEITNLKKEVERLTEAIATKEARWGASQARLRNQVKSLEKENMELKSEIEKLKKQNLKKVTFGNEKNINTKIMHAINSELGKLKPHLMRNGTAKQKYQCLTARVDSNLQNKPIRRIKSVPDLKKSSEKRSDLDENPSLSPEPEFVQQKNVGSDKNEVSRLSSEFDQDSDMAETSDVRKREITDNFELKNRNRSSEDVGEGIKRVTKNCGSDTVEAVLHETFFGQGDRGDYNGTKGTISEIKRRLENLNLLHHFEPLNGDGDGRNLSHGNIQTSCESSESAEEDDDAVNTPDTSDKLRQGDWNKYAKNSLSNLPCMNYHCQTKIDDNGVREKTYDDGRREIFYPSGNVKKISADGRIVKMIYYNGDMKETDIAEGSEKYFYAETKTWHTTYSDGLEVLEFPNGQTERRHPDGSSEILFENGCVRYCDPSGKDEWRFIDGTVIKTDKNGHKVLMLPNGQKEIHTKEYKKREYPDGTVKILHADGTQETRYASGRVRLKDKDGNLVMDSGGIR